MVFMGLKEDYGTNDRYWASAVFLDSSYLRYPQHQSVQLLPDKKWKDVVLEQSKLMFFLWYSIFDHNYIGYSDIEIQKVKRIYDWMNADVDPKHLKSIDEKLLSYFKAHDERRNTNFVKTFPELEVFIINVNHYVKDITQKALEYRQIIIYRFTDTNVWESTQKILLFC